MSITERTYEGSELTLFRDALNWKSYLFDFLAPHMKGDRLLEVGSGLGGNVPHYAHLSPDITLLEPDGDLMAESIRYNSDLDQTPLHIQGTTGSLHAEFIAGFPEGRIRTLRHLEAVGVFPSLMNKLVLRQSAPTPAQVKMWDTWMVPVSRAFVDRLVRGTFGKSVIGVIEKPSR